ncbi:hypothetical protein M0802_009734 [Mischocyttarus mexicanus]|nr:hypothetical protein M0802_009734 [Mischocyttarus mexicanus]
MLKANTLTQRIRTMRNMSVSYSNSERGEKGEKRDGGNVRPPEKTGLGFIVYSGGFSRVMRKPEQKQARVVRNTSQRLSTEASVATCHCQCRLIDIGYLINDKMQDQKTVGYYWLDTPQLPSLLPSLSLQNSTLQSTFHYNGGRQ